MTHTPEVSEKLKALEAKFRDKLSLTKEEIQTLCLPEETETLLSIVHKLSGSAGTFGFQNLSLEMRDIETRMRTAISDDNKDTITQLREEAVQVLSATIGA